MNRKLQVFISSTFTDLIEERQAAVGAVLKAGHIPAGMELFTAGDRSQMVTIEEWIDQSDVYMLILGGRYGSIEPISGISYTELEYDYAVRQGKPLFAVVINDDALEAKIKTTGSKHLERENPQALALFRKKVLSNMSSFFDDEKDIKLCVYESLGNFAARRELKGWVSGDDVVDTRPLFEEIKKLSEESRALKEALENVEKRALASPPLGIDKSEQFAEIRKLLEAIDIKVPAKLAGGKEITSNLLNIFFGNKDTLISGVTNSGTASEHEIFFFYNIAPKLQLHGLMTDESVSGVRYRRSFVTRLGNEFLASIERQSLLGRKVSEQESASVPALGGDGPTPNADTEGS